MQQHTLSISPSPPVHSGETHATTASFMPSHAPALNSGQMDEMDFVQRLHNFVTKACLWLYLSTHMRIQGGPLLLLGVARLLEELSQVGVYSVPVSIEHA